MNINFLIPGDIDTPTGGYRYDRRIAQEWREQGHECRITSLPGDYPFVDAVSLEEGVTLITNLPKPDAFVIDGLAGGADARLTETASKLAPVIALIHHPLCLETGLDASQASHLEAEERKALTFAKHVVTTSSATAETVSNLFDFPPERIETVLPGVERGRVSKPKNKKPVRLLCVGSIVERKGHRDLLKALASLDDRNWHLDCIGSKQFDPELAAELEDTIKHTGLSGHVALHGSVSENAIEAAYERADVFVLPSLYEGYGMAYAEAIVRGLPVIGTTAGAIPDTVPQGCGILVEPGNTAQLAEALTVLINNADKRMLMHEKTLAAESSFPEWGKSARQFANLLKEIA